MHANPTLSVQPQRNSNSGGTSKGLGFRLPVFNLAVFVSELSRHLVLESILKPFFCHRPSTSTNLVDIEENFRSRDGLHCCQSKFPSVYNVLRKAGVLFGRNPLDS